MARFKPVAGHNVVGGTPGLSSARPMAIDKATRRSDLAELATAKAEEAAAHAGIQTRNLQELDEIVVAATMLEGIWGGDRPKLSADLMRAMTHAGHYMAAAYRDDEIAGAIFGFLGNHDRRSYLHSHILGDVPGR